MSEELQKKMTVLVVDDEYAFCRSLKLFFEKIGFDVRVATNGEHALDLARECNPALMTLDIRMPGLNGYDVLQKAKRHHPDLPIIVITAIEVPKMEEMLEHSGAHALLQKPLNLDELSDTVYRLVGNPWE